MAQYVILGTANLNQRSQVVVHSTMPTGNNSAGIAWTTALVDSLGGAPITSQVPASLLSTGIQDDLNAGTRFEWMFSVSYDANDPSTAKRDTIEAAISSEEPIRYTEKQNELRFWGYQGSI